jgi:hypothetical protein
MILDDALEKRNRIDQLVIVDRSSHTPPLGDSLSTESDTLRGKRTVPHTTHAPPPQSVGSFSLLKLHRFSFTTPKFVADPWRFAPHLPHVDGFCAHATCVALDGT